MKPWQFSKPKGPGFGLNKNFYLSVLAGQAVLPRIAEIAAPKPANGEILGFAVPLTNTTDKSLLAMPMSRGMYAIASQDRKTVLKLMVMSDQEAGFSPEAIARSGLANRVTPEVLARIRSTWHLLQITIESHDPGVYPSLDFMLNIAKRCAELTNGVVADPVSERYLLPSEVFQTTRISPSVDAREHVQIHFRPEPVGNKVYTRGLIKITQPELEIDGVEDRYLRDASRMIISAAQGVFEGHIITNGAMIDRFEARQGGLNRALWDGIPVYELLPPTGKSTNERQSPC